jgi:hypothetical protein
MKRPGANTEIAVWPGDRRRIACGADLRGTEVAHRSDRKQRHGEDPVQRAKRGLGRHTKTEDQQCDGIERDLRDRIERSQDRFRSLAGQSVGADRASRRPAERRSGDPVGGQPPIWCVNAPSRICS